jgi:hypothetical protein
VVEEVVVEAEVEAALFAPQAEVEVAELRPSFPAGSIHSRPITPITATNMTSPNDLFFIMHSPYSYLILINTRSLESADITCTLAKVTLMSICSRRNTNLC